MFQLKSDNEKSLLKDAALFLGSFFLFVYIHLPLALRFGYDVDEILDYTGSQIAQDVYLSFGRWGLVLWGWLVGNGMKPWSGGATAGLILCLALILQTKILFSSKTQFCYKAIYCALYIASCQFAYTMCYSMQVEGFALSILFATLACFVLFSTQKFSFQRVLSSIGLLYVALSFYQTSGLLFFSLFLCCLLKALDNSNLNLKKTLCLLAIICVSSIILFFLTKKLILFIYNCQDIAISFTQNHEENNLKQGILFTNASLLHLLKNRFYDTVSCNMRLQICTLIALLIWAYHMVTTRKFTKLCIMIAAIIIPYIATLFLYTPTRTYLFIPLISAFFITITISQRQYARKGRWWIIPIIIIICISAAHQASRMSLLTRTRHDNNLMERFIQYTEARKLMLESGLDTETSKIIVFEKGWNEKAPNFYHSYPFKNFHLGTYKDYETYKYTLDNMPSWPASGSIARDENVIIIKGNLHW